MTKIGRGFPAKRPVILLCQLIGPENYFRIMQIRRIDIIIEIYNSE